MAVVRIESLKAGRLVVLGLMLFSLHAGSVLGQQPIAPSANGQRVQGRSDGQVERRAELAHLLRYRFAAGPAAVVDVAKDLDRPYSLYQFDVHSTETVQREGRESVLVFDLNSELFLGAKVTAAEAQATSGENYFDLLIFPHEFTATDMLARRGSRVWRFDGVAGLAQTYRDGRVTLTGLNERFVERQSLASAAAKPAVMPLRNGALVGKGTESKFFERLRFGWIEEAVVGMLAPLPGVEIKVGQKWKAGMPLQFAGPTEASIVRCDVEFRSYDLKTGMAEIAWSFRSDSQSLTPTSGIHHVDENSVATVEASGVIFVHGPTGWLLSSDTMIRASIANDAKPELAVDFVRTMHLQCHNMPTEILNWSKGSGSKEPMIANVKDEDDK